MRTDLRKYKHLFFDLDDTLWDYRTNARETVSELYWKYKFNEVGQFSEEEFATEFMNVNAELWHEFDRGRIKKERIRKERFQMVLDRLGYSDGQLGQRLNNDFMRICPTKSNVPEGTKEVLHDLSDNYHLHIITNGFVEVQHIKLKSGGLTQFFDQVIISETVGIKKPDPLIFDHALQTAGAEPDHALMIGDNLETDIKGAINAGIDQVFYNPLRIIHNVKVTYEILRFTELRGIL